MVHKRKDLQCFLFLIFIKLSGAQVPNKSSNQGSSSSSLQPRFSDLGAMGFPNFGSGRFGNPTSNYPTNSFFPFGNQNHNMKQPQDGTVQDYPNDDGYQKTPQGYPQQQGYPNQHGHPYQSDSVNPYPNYQQPRYPNQNFQNPQVQGGFQNQNAFPYQGDSNTRYPNYQRPSYPNIPDDGSLMYPDDISEPYQNGGMPTNQGGPGQVFQYPEDSQYPSQGNFQGNGRPNEVNPNFHPDDLDNLGNTNINFPDGPYQYQPNQYDPQTNSPNQNFRPVQGQFGSFPNYPLNTNPNTNIQFPANNLGGANGNPSAIQYPNQDIPGSGAASSVNPGNFNNELQNQPLLPKNQGNIPNDNGVAAILGKPVIVPSTTTSPGQIVLDNSNAAIRKKCVQDCPTTSEYSPVCGSDNVTYMNPGKFDCAQKCDIAVHLRRTGRCDAVRNNLEQ